MSEPIATASSSKAEKQPWGRVLICGGTEWTKLGKKEPRDESRPDLLEPHILRSLSNVRATSIHASCSGAHAVVLAIDGSAYLFGRNGNSALGVASVEEVSEWAPLKIIPADLPGASSTGTQKIVHAACGRHHTLLVGDKGDVWTAGTNVFGQCGHSPSPSVDAFTRIGRFGPGSEEKAAKVAAGVTFSLVLTESGKVIAFGSGEHGQLGNGRTGEHIVKANKIGFDVIPEGVEVMGFDPTQKVVAIAAGAQHSVAIAEDGLVYVWGYNGYCRLGLGNQVDEMRAKVVPNFASPNPLLRGGRVACGPTNTIVVDRNGMLWMAGKWKNTGEGSSGSPYSSFRYFQEIQTCKIHHASSGGVTQFVLTPEDTDLAGAEGRMMVVCWGQGANNGELGLGPENPKSQTKPDRNRCLLGVDVFDIAASQNTSLFLARPASEGRYTELPRHPEALPNVPEACLKCGKAEEGKEELECEKCDTPYHLSCLDPPLASVPEGEWFCPTCSKEEGGGVGGVKPPTAGGKGVPKRGSGKRVMEEGGDGDEKKGAKKKRV